MGKEQELLDPKAFEVAESAYKSTATYHIVPANHDRALYAAITAYLAARRSSSDEAEVVGYLYRLRYGPDNWSHQLMYSDAAVFRRLPADDVREVVPLVRALDEGMGEARPKRCHTCRAPRTGDTCHKCGGPLEEVAGGWTEPRLPPIDKIRRLAESVGYGLGVHGSLERDLDLIAAPWIDEAVSAEELAQHIATAIGGTVLAPEERPLGRWSCNIQMDGWYKLIDLSVAPRLPAPIQGDAK